MPRTPAPGAPEPDAANRFGEQLRACRQALGLTQAALAERVHVDQSYINRLEKGDREPPRRELVTRLAEALDVSGAERQRLLAAAGHPPDWLLPLAPDDPTLMAVAQLLADADLEDDARRDFRRLIALVIDHWDRRA